MFSGLVGPAAFAPLSISLHHKPSLRSPGLGAEQQRSTEHHRALPYVVEPADTIRHKAHGTRTSMFTCRDVLPLLLNARNPRCSTRARHRVPTAVTRVSSFVASDALPLFQASSVSS